MARDPLKQVKIAAPCPASWNSMKGDERVRFCSHCSLNVYNISEMDAPEARALLQSHEGRLCIRMYQRADGTVITKNCPVGVSAMRKRLAYALSIAAALSFGSFAAAMSSLRSNDEHRDSFVDNARRWPVVGPAINLISPPVSVTAGAIAMPVMGKMAVAPPPPSGP